MSTEVYFKEAAKLLRRVITERLDQITALKHELTSHDTGVKHSVTTHEHEISILNTQIVSGDTRNSTRQLDAREATKLQTEIADLHRHAHAKQREIQQQITAIEQDMHELEALARKLETRT